RRTARGLLRAASRTAPPRHPGGQVPRQAGRGRAPYRVRRGGHRQGTRGNRRERRSPHRPAASARIHGRLDRVSAPQGRGRRSDGARGGTPSLSETQETRTSNNSRRKSDGASNAALPEYAGVPPDVEAHGLPPRISPPPVRPL